MARSFSDTLKLALSRQDSDEVLVILLTLSHPDFPTPLRICNDSKIVTSGGEDFLPLPFLITMPDDSADQVPQVNVTLDAVDRTLINAIRSISDAPSLLMEFVLASSPDMIEAGWDFIMRDIAYDAFTITAVLSYEQILDEPFPGDQVTPTTLPGVFS
jgi:Domain of unknown function (DUF1833)